LIFSKKQNSIRLMKEDSKEKLVKIDFVIKYSVVGLNIYDCADLNKLAAEIFRANRDDIISEALEDNSKATVEFTGTEIKTKEDLPDGYNHRCFPWLSVTYGSKESKPIGYYLNEIKK